MSHWNIVPFPPGDPTIRAAAARILVDGFRQHWPGAWPTLAAAETEVDDALAAGKIAFVASSDDDDAVGWIGAQPHYDGNVWELHPLVVRADAQGGGIGRALVARIEDAVRARGALTLWVGTDDEAGLTSIGGRDLYPAVLDKLRAIRNLAHHPMGFYRKLGFEVVGVVPDANGFGRPDILMAKRVGTGTSPALERGTGEHE